MRSSWEQTARNRVEFVTVSSKLYSFIIPISKVSISN